MWMARSTRACCGNLHVQGGGDPKWVMERIVAALEAVHAQGVTVIQEIVLDHQSAFQIPRTDPAAFDGERLRPYKNARALRRCWSISPLLLGFAPDAAAGVARVKVEPPLAGVRRQRHGAAVQRPLWRLAQRGAGPLR